MQSSGSPTKVGYYQDLHSSAMFDGEGIWSNATQSVDFSASGSDNETDIGHLHYFSPHVEADLDFERFQQQLDVHDFAGFNYLGQNNTAGPDQGTGTLGSGPTNPQNPRNVVLFTEQPSPGQDYAIRVEWKANFKGNLTENLQWRLNVFGIDKEGNGRSASSSTVPRPPATDRICLPPCLWAVLTMLAERLSSRQRANPTAGVPAVDGNLTNQCHVTTQSQHIDWQTTEVTPSLQLRLDCDTYLEYSHLIRPFTANDQAVGFNYDTGVGV